LFLVSGRYVDVGVCHDLGDALVEVVEVLVERFDAVFAVFFELLADVSPARGDVADSSVVC